jgi:hypothetical protein
LLRRAQKKNPSSVGFDIVQDFRILYAHTKHKRLK